VRRDWARIAGDIVRDNLADDDTQPGDNPSVEPIRLD